MEHPSEEEMELYIILCGWKYHTWFGTGGWDKGEGYPALRHVKDAYTFEMNCKEYGEEDTLKEFHSSYDI